MRILNCLFLLLAITGCTKQLKEKIGIETSGPNEYLVERNKPLEKPPHYNLPLPTSN